MKNELVEVTADQLNNYYKLATVLANSGRFSGDSSPEQAMVKVLAGLELGMGPIRAMTELHVVQGKVTLGAGAVSAMVKGSGKYDYKVLVHSETECVLEFYQLDNGEKEKIGQSRFTMDDANKAGLTGKAVWKQYPRNMLFSRAMTNGARWFTPDVFKGSIYTPEELGDDASVSVNDDNVIIDVTPPETPNLDRNDEIDKLIGLAETTFGISKESIIEQLKEMYDVSSIYLLDPKDLKETLKKIAGASPAE